MCFAKHSLGRKILKITGISFLSLIAVFGLLVGVIRLYGVNYTISSDGKKIVNDTGLVKAEGKFLYDVNGDPLTLRGTNVGNLFVSEGWLSVTSAGASYDKDNNLIKDKDGNIQYPELTQEKFLSSLKQNPNLDDTKIYSLLDTYYKSWFSDEDFFNIKYELGMNALRLPFYWRNLLNYSDGVFSRIEEDEAFKYLDMFMEGCKKYEIYCILDLHGAPGSQNGYEHSGDNTRCDLWTNESYINATCDLWQYVASHYTNTRPDLGSYIATYDLLNEPLEQKGSGWTTKKCWDVFDKIYDAIRLAGDNHVITFCGCWSYDNLPNPVDYSWSNIQYEYHYYNWNHSWLSYDVYNLYHDAQMLLHDYNVPVLFGEFTFFDNQSDWKTNLDRFEKRGYSWTTWTYKGVVTGWWDNSWNIYTYKLNLDVANEEQKVNIATATYEEILDIWSKTITDNCEAGFTFNVLKEYLSPSAYQGGYDQFVIDHP